MSPQRPPAILISVILMLGLTGPAQAQGIENDVSAIHSAYSDWSTSTNAKDIVAWSRYLAPDPIFAPPNHPALTTRDQVIEYYSDLFADSSFVGLDCIQEAIIVARSRDLAWSRGICSATFLDQNGSEVTIPSKWNKVWVRNDQGEWKCRMNTWNGND